jgi:S-formylglutathione hydrolase FrmB
MWHDSPISGMAATFVADELVREVDRQFRTVALPAYRGIAGHSMGGQGALQIVMNHPKVFASAYSLNAMMSFNESQLLRYSDAWRLALSEGQRSEDWSEMACAYLAMCMAFCWTGRQPMCGVKFPIVDSPRGPRVEPAVAERFLSQWPSQTFQTSNAAATLRGLLGLGLEVALDDEFDWGVESNRRFIRQLQAAGVPYQYTEAAGSHTSGIAERLENRVLPFFSTCFAKAGAVRDDLIESRA